MENSNYNSLTDQLRQNGIIKDSEENFFEKMKSEIVSQDIYDEADSIETLELNKEDEKMENIQPLYSKKRINEYDLDLIRNIGANTKQNKNHQSPFENIAKIINFRNANKGNYSLSEIILSRFFPKLYSAKLIKKTISKMFELNIDTKTLLNKTIPYGENNSRYEDLIKYLNCANELQTKLKRKID